MTTHRNSHEGPLPRDTIFTEPLSGSLPFTFDESVAAVFDDMLERSVPCYATVQHMMVDLATEFAAPDSRIYDMGCSLGTTVLDIAQRDLPDGVEVVGIDSSGDMLAEARRREDLVRGSGSLRAPVRFIEAFVDERYPLDDASVVILSLILQFLRPLERPGLVRSIHDRLRPGGAVLLFEKAVTDSPQITSLYIDRYYSFKEANGYSKEEIAHKRTALENVLVPFQIRENIRLLRDAGFGTVHTFFQWFNFVGFLAVKDGKPE